MRKGLLGSLAAVLASAGLAMAQRPGPTMLPPPSPTPVVVGSQDVKLVPTPDDGSDAKKAEPIGPPKERPEPIGPPKKDSAKDAFIDPSEWEAQMSLLSGRYYASADYLLWWTKGQRLPVLVTTGPDLTLGGSATAGILGVEDTAIVYGGNEVDTQSRSGFRFTFGYWFNEPQTLGFEGSLLYLNPRGSLFSANSGGSPIISRPYVQLDAVQNGTTVTTTATENALLVASSTQSGAILVNTKNEMWGAEANFRYNVDGSAKFRADLLAGFRFLQVKDELGILSASHAVPGSFIPVLNQPLLVAESQIVGDRIATRNDFYGGQIGTHIECKRNRWTADFIAKLALGMMHQVVDFQGVTIANNTAGFGGTSGPTVFSGGLYSQPGQLQGRHTRNEFGIVPEIGLNVGYQFTDHFRAYAGYSVLYFRSDIVRPGTQLERFSVPAGSTAKVPAFNFRDQDFWAQGISAGLEVSY